MTTQPPTPVAESWQTRVAEKQAACLQAIPKAWILRNDTLETLPSNFAHTRLDLVSLNVPRRSGILTEKEVHITEDYTVAELLKNLANGTLTSLEVTVAFSKRAAIAQQLTNCLTETFFDRAQERARTLDEMRAQGKLAGPLHGLPISLKDTYQVEGTQATVGTVSLLDKTSEINSTMVDMLLDLGAVLYAKTNVPPMLMTTESHNNVFGRTLNPWNTMLTAGGSTGGEAALIALRGSVLGVGTDIGGSIRIPSLCCGLYGFKATAGRLPFGGQPILSSLGDGIVLASAGPMATDMETLKLFMKNCIDSGPHQRDETVVDSPWKTIKSNSKLRIGILPEDPIFPLHPPVRETVSKAAKALQSQGHDIVALTAAECQVSVALEVVLGCFQLQPEVYTTILSSGEPLVPSMKTMTERINHIDFPLLARLAGLSNEQKREALQKTKTEIVEIWQQLWAKHDLDVVMAPVAQCTAVEHDQFGLPPYTAFINILDYPACVIPWGIAKISDETFVLGPGQSAPAYNAEAIRGAPCAVQVFARNMQDEKCLDVATVIDACLKAVKQ